MFAVTLTPSLTEIMLWKETEVVLADELRDHLDDRFNDFDGTTVYGVESDVNLLVADMGDGYLTAFTFVTDDGSHTVLVTDNEDVNCWSNGWIEQRLAQS